ASIGELNCVRKQLSRVKGGRLARACTAGTLIALVISDIVGDPLDIIGSGPTVADSSTPAEALEVLRRFDPSLSQTPASIIEFLKRTIQDTEYNRTSPGTTQTRKTANVINRV